MSVWRMPSIARRFVGQAGAGEALISVLISDYCADRDIAVFRRSHGARSLADWIMRAPVREMAFDAPGLSALTVTRILLGSLDPAPETRTAIATVTCGAIAPDMFDAYPAAAPAVPPPIRPAVRVSPAGDGFTVSIGNQSEYYDRVTAIGLREALGRAIDLQEAGL